MRKVLALMGSPRKNKNTDMLLDAMLAGMDERDYEIKKIYIGDKDIGPCKACDYCADTGQCVIEDDMEEIYRAFDEGHIFILASPLYFNTVSGISKNLIDRCQKYWSKKYRLGQNYKRDQARRGFLIGVGGAPYSQDHFSAIGATADLFFRAINADYIGSYFISNTDRQDVKDRKDVLDELKDLGSRLGTCENFRIHR